jgi:hypothetical protein
MFRVCIQDVDHGGKYSGTLCVHVSSVTVYAHACALMLTFDGLKAAAVLELDALTRLGGAVRTPRALHRCSTLCSSRLKTNVPVRAVSVCVCECGCV